MKAIVIEAAKTQRAVNAGQCDVEDWSCETVSEAKNRAKYLLTDEYQKTTNMSERF